MVRRTPKRKVGSSNLPGGAKGAKAHGFVSFFASIEMDVLVAITFINREFSAYKIFAFFH